MSSSVLIVAAHPDDEVLGCGGTISRHLAEGDVVHAIFMTDGVGSRLQVSKNDLIKRNAAAEKARHILGISENFYLGLPDNRLDSLPLIEIIQRVEVIINKLKPDIIYTHHHGDLNVDHRITHQAVLTSCRPIPGNRVLAIYAFEIMSSTDWSSPNVEPFVPNHYVDISRQIEIKIKALKAYKLEMRTAPHSRNIEHMVHLAHHRGHTVGVKAAEAFVTVRTVR
jgi:LmbE family N-acetylglucosaminyl deacetylase